MNIFRDDKIESIINVNTENCNGVETYKSQKSQRIIMSSDNIGHRKLGNRKIGKIGK